MAFTYPTVSEFKEYFVRDFPYGTNPAKTILDVDITKAQNEAKFNINQNLFPDQEQFTIAFHYITAHYLVMDLRASSQGISGQFDFLESSKSVGSVSQSFSIPDRILQNPNFAYFAKTYYGMKYLSLILPRLSGAFFIHKGRTLP